MNHHCAHFAQLVRTTGSRNWFAQWFAQQYHCLTGEMQLPTGCSALTPSETKKNITTPFSGDRMELAWKSSQNPVIVSCNTLDGGTTLCEFWSVDFGESIQSAMNNPPRTIRHEQSCVDPELGGRKAVPHRCPRICKSPVSAGGATPHYVDHRQGNFS